MGWTSSHPQLYLRRWYQSGGQVMMMRGSSPVVVYARVGSERGSLVIYCGYSRESTGPCRANAMPGLGS